MHRRDEAWKNLVAGALGGLAGSWVMTQYMSVQQKTVRRARQEIQEEAWRAFEMRRKASGEISQRVEADCAGERNRQDHPTQHDERTAKVAKVISEKVFRRKLNERQVRIAGPAVHYAFGTLMGAWYGVLAELTPVATSGMGTFYGAAVWLGADEIALPVLRLSSSPFQDPVSQQAGALGAHAVYGISMELVRRGLLTALGAEERHQSDREQRRAA
jgi:putative membrane protein